MNELQQFYEKNKMIILLAIIFIICYVLDIAGTIDRMNENFENYIKELHRKEIINHFLKYFIILTAITIIFF